MNLTKNIPVTPVYLSFCFLLLTMSPVQAQLFDYGLKGGVSISSLANTSNSEAYKGFNFGMFLNIRPFIFPFSIQPELNYVRTGNVNEYSNELPEPLSGVRETLTIDYVQVPVLIKYYLPLIGPLDPHLNIGPYYGWHVDSSFESDLDYTPVTTDRIRDRDYGLVFGFGTEVNVLLTIFHLDLRFVYGMETVFEEEVENDEKNRMISIAGGFAF